MFRKTLIVLFSSYLLMFVIACNCNCEKQQYFYFSSDEIVAEPINYKMVGDTTFTIINKDTLEFKNYGLNVMLKGNLMALQPCKGSTFNLFNSAYACSCVEDLYSAKDPVTELKIYTLLDFDALHTSNSDVTELFVVLKQKYNPTAIEKLPLKSSIEQLNSSYISFDAIASSYLGIFLNANATLNDTLQFKVLATTRAGKELEVITNKTVIER